MAACRRVGVALDSSVNSRYALQWAVNNFTKEGDKLIIIIVNKNTTEEMGFLWQETGSPLVPLAEISETGISVKYGIQSDPDIISFLNSEAKKRQIGVAFKIYWGDPREKLCDAVVDLPLDCILMGSRGLGVLKRAMLGSVSNYVVNNARCPVTVVKLPADYSGGPSK